MPPFSAILDQLVNSASGISKQHERRDGEDTIDHMHRLARAGLGVDRISEITGVPWYNVEYWMYSNGYDSDRPAASVGVHLGGVRHWG